MREGVQRLGYGNGQIGSSGTTFWLRGPLAISAAEQTGFLSGLAHQRLPFPVSAQQQVAEITTVDSGPGWSLHAKTDSVDALWREQLGRRSLQALAILSNPTGKAVTR